MQWHVKELHYGKKRYEESISKKLETPQFDEFENKQFENQQYKQFENQQFENQQFETQKNIIYENSFDIRLKENLKFLACLYL